MTVMEELVEYCGRDSGFWSVTTDTKFPKVDITMRIGDAILNHMTLTSVSQYTGLFVASPPPGSTDTALETSVTFLPSTDVTNSSSRGTNVVESSTTVWVDPSSSSLAAAAAAARVDEATASINVTSINTAYADAILTASLYV